MSPLPAPPDLSLRPAAAADQAALGRLATLLVELHHRFDPARFIAPRAGTPEGYGRFLVSQAAGAESFVLVAEADGAVVGYVYATVEGADWMALRGPAGVIQDIVVDPDARGRGVGRRLLEAGAEALLARGVPRVMLSTAARNEAAQRFFAAAGFRPTMVEMTRDA